MNEEITTTEEQTLIIQQIVNLALQHHQRGELAKAESFYQEVLKVDPNQPVALHFLGVIAYQSGKSDVSVDLIRKAISINPDYAEAYSNLGNTLKGLGILDEAETSYNKAISIKPDYFEAYHNLGNVLSMVDKLDDAVASYDNAITIKPDYFEAHSNRGNALKKLGRLNEALTSYNKAIAIKPDYSEAHNNIGLVLLELGRFDEAMESYNRGFQLIYGGPWLNAVTYTSIKKRDDWLPPEVKNTSIFKLRETIDQFEYLIAKGRIDFSFQCIVEGYREVLTEIELKSDTQDQIKLTHEQLQKIGSSYNHAIYCPNAPRIKSGAINKGLNFQKIENEYFSSSVSVITLDNFLKPETLFKLREFCLESTIFFEASGNSFTGSTISSGFNCYLLSQIADEIKDSFPRILGEHSLGNIWIYRYNNQSKGVVAHADEGAVTFNLWITPSQANLYPKGGGLIVYTKEFPCDWDFRYYNTMKNTTIVEDEITKSLADSDTVTIPHRQNRAALFNSNLFHKSDQIHFKEGYENRRMNITFLFGKRGGGHI